MTRELRGLRQTQTAVVFKKDRPAARFARTRVGLELRYLEEYLADPGPALASTLPLTTEPMITAGGALPPYFSGLLPEGRRLSALRRAVKTSADDEFTMLLAVGTDAIGDVRVFPGDSHTPQPPRVVVKDWDDVSFRELVARELGEDPDRRAMPGVQPKASAVMLSVPVASAGTSYILKLDPPEFPYLCRNEALMMRMARQCRLTTADAELRTDSDGVDALLVRRFDRASDGSRLAVEDACQVAGRYPADKYLLTTEEACRPLVALASAPPVTARDLVRWIAFAYASCNGDLHAKNLAVAERPDGLMGTAPAYDLPSSYPYGDTTMALTLNGKDREDIGRDDFVVLAAALGVSERAVSSAVDDVVRGLDAHLDELAELPFERRVIHKWRRAIEDRLNRLVPDERHSTG